MELWKLLGDLHPKLVQFPLVLLLAGLVFDVLGLVRRSRRFHWGAGILSGAGTVMLLVAFICGIYAEIWAGRAGVPQDAIEWHEFLANVSAWGFVILTAWRLLIGAHHRRALIAYATIGLLFYALLTLTAYFGGQLVFGYGAAVTGARANTILSIHDLNTLATRQTDLNLKYSEMMHHIFGWLTLALSGSLLATAVFPKQDRKLRWIGPALLLVGGVFLFFFADLDLYHFTDLRQLRDREVQLHKTIALILTVVGAAALWRRNHRQVNPQQTNSSQRLPKADPPPSNLPGGSRPIAIMALIGGGLLFTHVHTVAPYANVAAGVYIAHMVMGLTALSIGAARLLQDRLPHYRRMLATTFAVLMCVESVLLITYNEGLPWYIGYGRYNRWGPHGGTVAPFGDMRAELTFDNQSQTLNVYALDRFADRPISVPASAVNLLIARGYTEIAVPLKAIPNPADHSPASSLGSTHFAAQAPWLKDTAAFSARLQLPAGDSTRTGYFDPWVAPVIAAVPPNEVARFQCPMHDGIIAQGPGRCPLCGMPLVPIQSGVRNVLHDPPFDLKLMVAPQPAQTADLSEAIPAADEMQKKLVFKPIKSGELLRDLPVVHEHPMHVTIVSADLEYFDHVHPVAQKDGSLQIDYRFPQPGDYLVFAEYMPAGERDQIFRVPVNVGAKTQNEPTGGGTLGLIPTPAAAKPLADQPDITAELNSQPRHLLAGTHAMLLFRLLDHGQPVTDLQPYMGAMGHCAIISQDTQTFLHCHPEQLYPPEPQTRGGPEIAFHTVFPKPGRYKIWGQFMRQGKVVIADFVVQVDAGLLPPRVVNFILNDY